MINLNISHKNGKKIKTCIKKTNFNIKIHSHKLINKPFLKFTQKNSQVQTSLRDNKILIKKSKAIWEIPYILENIRLEIQKNKIYEILEISFNQKTVKLFRNYELFKITFNKFIDRILSEHLGVQIRRKEVTIMVNYTTKLSFPSIDPNKNSITAFPELFVKKRIDLLGEKRLQTFRNPNYSFQKRKIKFVKLNETNVVNMIFRTYKIILKIKMPKVQNVLDVKIFQKKRFCSIQAYKMYNFKIKIHKLVSGYYDSDWQDVKKTVKIVFFLLPPRKKNFMFYDKKIFIGQCDFCFEKRQNLDSKLCKNSNGLMSKRLRHYILHLLNLEERFHSYKMKSEKSLWLYFK